MAQGKLIITFDPMTDNFEIDKPDDMDTETIVSFVAYVLNVLRMQIEAENEPDNIINFPVRDVLVPLAHVTPDDESDEDEIED